MVDRQWGTPTRLRSHIPLASLILTLVVAEFLNFRHAANALGVSPSSVSARLKNLEKDLGVLLFERQSVGDAIGLAVLIAIANRHVAGLMGDALRIAIAEGAQLAFWIAAVGIVVSLLAAFCLRGRVSAE